jgi:hypothetical protein
MVIVICSDDKGMTWNLDETYVEKSKLLQYLMREMPSDEIVLPIVPAQIFKWIYTLLGMSNEEMIHLVDNIEMATLLDIGKACDFLDMPAMLDIVAKKVANDINEMSFFEIKQKCDQILNTN